MTSTELPPVAGVWNFTHDHRTGAFNTNFGPTEEGLQFLISLAFNSEEFLTAVSYFLSCVLSSVSSHQGQQMVILPQVAEENFNVIKAGTRCTPSKITSRLFFDSSKRAHAPTLTPPLRMQQFKRCLLIHGHIGALAPAARQPPPNSHWLVVKSFGKLSPKVHQTHHLTELH